MTAETAGGNTGNIDDPTTPAVLDVIKTMDGDDSTPVHPVSQPAERLNVDLEECLIEFGVFRRRSMAQRRVLGCLGCRLSNQPGTTDAVRSMEIAQCNGTNNSGTRRILARLVSGDFLQVETPEAADPKGGRPSDLFSFTERAVATGIKDCLQSPAQCGLEGEGGTRRFNGKAEDILIEEGVFDTRGSAPRAILGCLACRLQSDEGGVHTRGLNRCNDIHPSHSRKVLRQMVEGGVLTAQSETGVPSGGHRVIYTLADTELAQKIVGSLEIPAQCGLRSAVSDDSRRGMRER